MNDTPPHSPLAELEQDDRFRIFAFNELVQLLTQLCEKQVLIRITPQGSTEPLLSALLEVDHVHGTIVFDGGRDPAINRRLESAQELDIVTDLDRVRVHFQVSNPKPVLVEGRAAFEVSFPESIMRLQRREFFRIAPPMNRPILVRLHSRMGADGSVTSARGVDISIGGMVMLIDGPVAGLAIGQVLPKTSITLPEIATIESGLEVRNLQFLERSGRTGTTRVGCRFVGLNQANTARVQRYINRLEVELRRRT